MFAAVELVIMGSGSECRAAQRRAVFYERACEINTHQQLFRRQNYAD